MTLSVGGNLTNITLRLHRLAEFKTKTGRKTDCLLFEHDSVNAPIESERQKYLANILTERLGHDKDFSVGHWSS